MKLKPQDLERISALTLAHYNQRAADFFEGTRDHDVSQNIEALLFCFDALKMMNLVCWFTDVDRF